MHFGGYPVKVWHEDRDGWIAIVDVPVNNLSVSAYGESPERAIQELRIAWSMIQEDIDSGLVNLPAPEVPGHMLASNYH